MTHTMEGSTYRRRAVLGGILVAPAAYFVAAAVLKYGLGFPYAFEPVERLSRDPAAWRLFNWISPVVFLGGGLAALLLNGLAVAAFELRREPETLAATILVRKRVANLWVAALSLACIALLLGYGVVENLRC
ncbi:MAG TPA: hypothetical protein VGK93_09310 [Candidatus Eisenbacteria bacterium]|jgi:hypothetical protein